MVFALHKFRHHLLGNKFVFYVNHMGLVYLIGKQTTSFKDNNQVVIDVSRIIFQSNIQAKQDSCSCKCFAQIARYHKIIRSHKINHKCLFILHKTIMVN
jgi:hypothetical protein